MYVCIYIYIYIYTLYIYAQKITKWFLYIFMNLIPSKNQWTKKIGCETSRQVWKISWKYNKDKRSIKYFHKIKYTLMFQINPLQHP